MNNFVLVGISCIIIQEMSEGEVRPQVSEKVPNEVEGRGSLKIRAGELIGKLWNRNKPASPPLESNLNNGGESDESNTGDPLEKLKAEANSPEANIPQSYKKVVAATLRYLEPRGNDRTEGKLSSLGTEIRAIGAGFSFRSERNANLTQVELDRYAALLKAGVINRSMYRNVLSLIKGPFDLEDEELMGETDSLAEQQSSKARQVLETLSRSGQGETEAMYILLARRFQNLGKQVPHEEILNPESLLKFVSMIDPLKYINFISGLSEETRIKYAIPINELGTLLYGAKFEYANSLMGLEQLAVTSPDTKIIEFANSGIKQSIELARDGFIKGSLADGFKLPAKVYSVMNEKGEYVDFRGSEIVVIDRKRDVKLKKLLGQASKIRNKYGLSDRTLFEVAKLVNYNLYSSESRQRVSDFSKNHDGREVLLGEMLGVGGMCRHESILTQVLLGDLGFDVSMRSGYLVAEDGVYGSGHAWNEVVLNGETIVVDVTNPPGFAERFKGFYYDEFNKLGGFTRPGENRMGFDYRDSDLAQIYST